MREVQSAPKAIVTHPSKLHKKKLGGKCTIQNNQPFSELSKDIANYESQELVYAGQPFKNPPIALRPFTCPSKLSLGPPTTEGDEKKLKQAKTQKVKEWLNKRQIEVLQRQADTETRKTRQILQPLLATEETFVQDVDNFLRYHDVAKLRRKEVQYKRWDERVHTPIRKALKETMAKINYDDLIRKRYLLHKEFLEYTNRTGHVSLEPYCPEDYYPLAQNPLKPTPLTACLPHLHDPLTTPQRMRLREHQVILDPQLSGLLPLSEKETSLLMRDIPTCEKKHTSRLPMNTEVWSKMHFDQIESPYCKRSRCQFQGEDDSPLQGISRPTSMEQDGQTTSSFLYSSKKLPKLSPLAKTGTNFSQNYKQKQRAIRRYRHEKDVLSAMDCCRMYGKIPPKEERAKECNVIPPIEPVEEVKPERKGPTSPPTTTPDSHHETEKEVEKPVEKPGLAHKEDLKRVRLPSIVTADSPLPPAAEVEKAASPKPDNATAVAARKRKSTSTMSSLHAPTKSDHDTSKTKVDEQLHKRASLRLSADVDSSASNGGKKKNSIT